MISFKNDYSEGAHPKVLEALTKTNFVQTDGYGVDPYCVRAAKLIQQAVACEDAEVFFLPGGTQTNLIFISHNLRQYEAVISADSGHIYVHETGSVEATGHKVFPVVSPDGKVTVEQVEQVIAFHGDDEHMVHPKMLYLSNPTELGTIYTKGELSALYNTCKAHGLTLFIDGARLSCALVADGNDIALKDYKELCDAFYIGGTKNGALFGEAMIIFKPELAHNMRYSIKQKGALLAKGRLLGVQFEALFENGLYLEAAKHANHMAKRLREGMEALGYEMRFDSPTNQQFPIIPNAFVKHLEQKYLFATWEAAGEDHSVIRLVTSWATEVEAVERFLTDLKLLAEA